MPLADLQQHIRDVVVTGGRPSVDLRLAGGSDALKRLAIHGRHYEASLTAAIVGRFPATGWLIGARRIEDAARAFVHEHPPTAPCIAEYGLGFSGFLATWSETAHMTYVPTFADLDWHMGRLAVSIDVKAVDRSRLEGFAPADLADASVRLQPGTHYLRASWPIDELMSMYLDDVSPESWALVDEDVHLEVRGARGLLRLSRLCAGEYAFRTSLAAGLSLVEAAGRALAVDAGFEPGPALLTLVNEQLITSIHQAGRP